jgi:hypothetical protein
MGSSKKTAKGRKNRNIKRCYAALALVAILIASTAAYVYYPRNSPSRNTTVPEGLKSLAAQYIAIMQSLNSSQTKTKMASQLNSAYNQTDLFVWEHSKLTFANDETGWYTEPNLILDRGMGICT